ncbi:MAG TPA: ABC transporter permease, partial [Streptosporangiaceae bacterium]|nr:ABC transporter permease [Streptosporangiaceae bacterium]
GVTARGRLRVVWYATRSGLAEYSAMFTWRSWLLGWYVRILAQVMFFATIGSLLGHRQLQYLLVGNAVMLIATHTLMTTASTTWERDTGTLPLLVASPTHAWLVLSSRSLFWLPEGLACTVGSLLIIGPPLGVVLSLPRLLYCLPMLLVIAASTYAFGLFLGSLVLTRNDLRNVVSNVASTTMMAVCGVNFPTSVLGRLRWIGTVLPLTHGLLAVRITLADGPNQHVLVLLAEEAVSGIAWLAAAWLVLRWVEKRSRRDGRIVFTG